MRTFIRSFCLLACLSTLHAQAATVDDDDAPKTGNDRPAAPAADQAVIDLESAARQRAGIKTQPLQAAQQQPEFTAYGMVISLEPLLTLRQQYLAATAQQDGAQARYREADLNLARTRHLHQQDIVSARRLEEQQAQWHSDKANLAASGYQQQSVLAASRLQWGETLSDWFIRSNGKAAEPFLNHQAQLLQITLPANSHLQAHIRDIHIDERGRRDKAVKATLIAAAPQVDPVTQGERYFFKTTDHSIAFGSHITAWIAGDAQQTSGVMVPQSAVVWHLGQAFVFVKTAEDRFSRRPLGEFSPTQGGYFAASGLQAGEEIVTTGAQTLLSQELKSQIPGDDDD